MCAFTACVRFLRRRGPAGLRGFTTEFLTFLLLHKTFVANSLASWYYGVDNSEVAGVIDENCRSYRKQKTIS